MELIRVILGVNYFDRDPAKPKSIHYDHLEKLGERALFAIRVPGFGAAHVEPLFCIGYSLEDGFLLLLIHGLGVFSVDDDFESNVAA